MSAIRDALKTEIAKREAAKQTARERERVNDPKRYAARLRAEAYRQENCPINIAARAVFPALHKELSGAAEYLKKIRAPITTRAEALRVEFGGNLARHAVYHMIDRHRRGTSFSPFVRHFLTDYNAARQSDLTLTREKFFGAYSDQILTFLLGYKLIEKPTTNDARIESLSLRVLVAAVAPLCKRYGANFNTVYDLERKAYARFVALDNAEIKEALKRGGLTALQRERQAVSRFKAFRMGGF